MQTLDAIKTRRTIRKFTEEPVSHEVIEKIVEASAYAPSWKNTQTARYIIIEETALKDRIAREAVMGFEWNTGIILGGNDRQQYNCNNNQCCSLIKSLLKSGILVLETALGLAL